jgi:hypothetical protein
MDQAADSIKLSLIPEVFRKLMPPSRLLKFSGRRPRVEKFGFGGNKMN